MKAWKKTRTERARRRAKSVEYWYRQKYGLAPTDPRFLATTYLEMLDEYDAAQMYDRIKKGIPLDSYQIVDMDSEMTEEEIFAAVDALAPLPASGHAEEKPWDAMTQAEQDAVLAGLTNGTETQKSG